MKEKVPATEVFAQAQTCFASIERWLCSKDALSNTHGQLEELLHVKGLELLRQLLQAHLQLRGMEEKKLAMISGCDGQERRQVEKSSRALMTVFGSVRVPRLAYGARRASDLHPADVSLNLPVEKASHGLRKLAAEEASKASFDEVVKAIDTHTGGRVAKRQAEELVERAARDFDDFYQSRPEVVNMEEKDLLVLSSDGKGIVVLHRDLRDETRKKAESSKHKLGGRLSGGEKKNRKRMATVAAVYNVAPFIRTPSDILADLRPIRSTSKARPKARDKRVWASVEKGPQDVIKELFDEAERRDPLHRQRWVILVDGAPHQIKQLEDEAARRSVKVTVVLDLIHVLEYLWKAAWCFFEKGDEDAQRWVTERATSILEGNSSHVAAGIRRSATLQKLTPKARRGADICCDYLSAKRAYLHYDEYLSAGYPIATGVIEGACRHLICDRLDITGARWSVARAEAVLRLRSLRSSGDFANYWTFHINRELQRNHHSRYAPATFSEKMAA